MSDADTEAVASLVDRIQQLGAEGLLPDEAMEQIKDTVADALNCLNLKSAAVLSRILRLGKAMRSDRDFARQLLRRFIPNQ